MTRKARNTRDLGHFADGRDENNLAEFPVALLSDSVPRGQKTIEFEDTLEDWDTGIVITRRVCITGSEKFGLPTAKDEQVLLALLQLTQIANSFTSPEVPFTKHQIIQLLGWQQRGWAYNRVEESLHRWKGTSIHYWNAWRDNSHKKWRDSAAVGVIDYFVLADGRKKQTTGGAVTSRVVWNKMFFDSFQSGYLKKLDFSTYRQLKRPAAKRAFRFLDKRFWHKNAWEFDLRQFACEKLGFSRAYSTGQLKERLSPALGELEKIGFIEPVRYQKTRPKLWTVAITKKIDDELKNVDLNVADVEVRKTKGSATVCGGDARKDALVAALLKRGVTLAVAKGLVMEYSAKRINDKLAWFDGLISHKDRRVSKNSAGFLVTAIREDYVVREKSVERLPPAAHGTLRKRSVERKPPVTIGPSQSVESGQGGQVAPLCGLSEKELAELEARAIRKQGPLFVAQYEKYRAQGDKKFNHLRRYLIESELTHAA